MNEPFEAPTSPGPDQSVRWRRQLAALLELAVLAVLVYAISRGAQVSQLVDLSDTTAGTPTGDSLRSLSRSLPGLSRTIAVMVFIAAQVPFSWKSKTLGLGIAGLRLDSEGRPVGFGGVLAWFILQGALAAPLATGIVAMIDVPGPVSAVWLAIGLAVWIPHEAVALFSGRSPVERLIGVEAELASAEIAPAPAPEVGPGWTPPETPIERRLKEPDPDLVSWRANTTINPVAAYGIVEMGPMVMPPDEPEHTVHIEGAQPSPRRVDPEEEALVARLREALRSEE